MTEATMEQLRDSPKRVFINDIDSYASKCIAMFLSECVVEAPTTESEVEEDSVTSDPNRSFQVFGNATDTPEVNRPDVLEVYNLDREELLFKLMDCDVIIYNITPHAEQVEEALWALSALHDKMDHFSGPKMFLLVSTVMTWACSKPDECDPDLPFTDKSFGTRRAHPNFNQHIDLERRVVQMGKTNKTLFSTYVVASGLQYGMGEQVLHFFFKTSWLGQECEIPMFGDGNNIVPTIHINDLASVIQNVIEHQPKPHYLLAVDNSNDTMEDIIKTIASALGHGKIQKKPSEEVFLLKELDVMEIDAMNVNLCMEADHIKELFSISWHCEAGLVENIEQVVEEYRQARGLQPIRLCVLGPPAVGKSTVSKQICEHYNLHYITPEETISETISQLLAAEENDEAQELQDSMEQNGGVLDDQLLVKVVKDKLMSNPCRNQGFVLDSFPITYEQAKELFGDEEQCSEDETTSNSDYSKMNPPEFVLCLDASDDFLKDRVMNLPENLVQEHNYEQEQFFKRLANYRQKSLEEHSVVSYFEELDITPVLLEIASSKEADCLLLMQKIFDTLGQPRNYGSSSQEVQEEKRREAEERMGIEAQEKAEEEIWEEEEARNTTARWEERLKVLEEARQKQKEELMKDQSLPMRKYLMTHVIPTLTQGLIECGIAQPQDPIDFIAEYLIRNNPLNDSE